MDLLFIKEEDGIQITPIITKTYAYLFPSRLSKQSPMSPSEAQNSSNYQLLALVNYEPQTSEFDLALEAWGSVAKARKQIKNLPANTAIAVLGFEWIWLQEEAEAWREFYFELTVRFERLILFSWVMTVSEAEAWFEQSQVSDLRPFVYNARTSRPAQVLECRHKSELKKLILERARCGAKFHLWGATEIDKREFKKWCQEEWIPFAANENFAHGVIVWSPVFWRRFLNVWSGADDLAFLGENQEEMRRKIFLTGLLRFKGLRVSFQSENLKRDLTLKNLLRWLNQTIQIRYHLWRFF